MAKHIVINGKNYRNVSKVELPTSDGGTALFRDAEEVMEVPTETLPISANGEYNVKEYAAVQVAVPTEGAEEVRLQAKTVEPSTVQKVVTADGGYTGLSSVTVEAIPVQEKTVVPSTVEQVITPDSGKYLSRVTVGATAGEPVLAGIAVEPTSITVPYNVDSGELYSYLTAMRGTYTLSGYTGSLERDLTAQLSEITIVGDTPAMGETAAVTLSYCGKTTTVTVTREQNTVAVTGVSLNQETITLTVGGTQGLLATVLPAIATNQEVSWESSAPTIAKVEKSDYLGAVVTALAAGSATITVKTADGGYTASCAVTVEAAEVAGTHTISYDSTVDDVQTVTFSPMPEEVSDGATTTITMTAKDLSESYYSKATTIAMNKVTASSAKIGSTKITGTDSITISNQTDDVEISAVPTTFFPSTNQAYADGTTYAPAYSGSVGGGCSRLYELKEGKQYVYTPPASLTTSYRIIFVRSDRTAMGDTSEQKPAAGAVTIPYSGSTSGGTASVPIPSDAKYFFIRHSSSLKTATEQEVFANNATMLLESV